MITWQFEEPFIYFDQSKEYMYNRFYHICSVYRNMKKNLLPNSSQKPHECSQCGQTFSESRILWGLIQNHTGYKPYKCSKCCDQLSKSGNLKSHFNIHTSLKPYHCNHCDKPSNQSSNLKKHLLIHNGTRGVHLNRCMMAIR